MRSIFQDIFRQRSLRLLLALMFTVMCGLSLGKAASESYFIGYVNTISFPVLLIVNGILLLVITHFYALFQQRVDRFRLMTYLLAIFVITLLAFQIILIEYSGRENSNSPSGSNFSFLPYFIFALYEIILLVFQIHFWTCANEIFGPAEGKKYFPLIGACGLIGIVIGGVIAGTFANLTGHFSLFSIWMVFFSVATVIAFRLKKQNLSSRAREIIDRPFIRMADWQNYPLLRFLAGISIPLWVVIHSIDWLFYHAINEVYPGDLEKTSALIGYLSSVTTFLALVLQIGVTSWVLKRLGVGFAYSSQAIGVLFASMALVARMFTARSSNLFSPRNIFAIFVRIFDEPFLYSFYDASSQLLFGAIPEKIRGQARTFIFGIIEPLMTLLTGIFFLVLERNGIPLNYLAFFAIILSVVWLILSLQVKTKYLHTLTTSLREQGDKYKKLNLLDIKKTGKNEKIGEELLASLSKMDDQIALLALEYISGVYPGNRFSIVYDKMQEMSLVVLAETLRIIRERKLFNAKSILLSFVDIGGKRSALVLRTLAELDSEGMQPLFFKYLASKDRHLFGEAIHYFLEKTHDERREGYIQIFKRLLFSTDSEDRLIALEINADLRQPVLIQDILRIVQIGSDNEIRLAIKVLENAHSLESTLAILDLLKKKEIRFFAIQALKKIVNDKPWIRDKLILQYQKLMLAKQEEPYYGNSERNLPILEQTQLRANQEGIIYALQAIGDKSSVKYLARILHARAQTLETSMRDSILTALNEIHLRMAKKQKISQEIIDLLRVHFTEGFERLKQYRRLYLWSMLNSQEMGKNTKASIHKHLLPALATEIDHEFQLSLKTLQLCFPRSDLDFLFPMLQSDNVRQRSEALEILQNIEKKDHDKNRHPKREIIGNKRIQAIVIHDYETGSMSVHDRQNQAVSKDTEYQKFERYFKEFIKLIETSLLPAVSAQASQQNFNKEKHLAFEQRTVYFLIEKSNNTWLSMLGLFLIGERELTRSRSILIRYSSHEQPLFRYAALWSLIKLGFVHSYQEKINQMSLKIELILFLKTVPIFAEVVAEDIFLLSEISKVIECRSNTELFKEGDPGKEFFVVKRGTIGIYKNQVLIAEVEEKDCFGEMAIVEHRARSATAKTQEPSELIIFDRSDFLKLMMSQPRITYSLFVNANRRLRNLHEKMLKSSLV